MLDSNEVDELMQKAIAVARNAYAPYSNFRVGAAVWTEKGIFTGVNVENASYGLGQCAERVALANAVSAGARSVSDIAVACIDADPASPLAERMPCGACRQWISELAPDAKIHISDHPSAFSISDLLPHAFALKK